MVRIAIVDDLEKDVRVLLEAIENWFRVHAAGEEMVCDNFGSGEEFLKLNEGSRFYDLIFLDICMKEIDGIRTAKILRDEGSRCQIIFVTTQKEYALEAYPVHPFDYLIKPFSQERIDQLLEDVMSYYFHSREEITVKVAYGEITIPLNMIISAVASGHGTEFFLSDGRRVQALHSFSESEKKLLKHSSFLTVNRALCINMDQIVQIREEKVVMNRQVTYPLKVRGRAQLVREMTQYQIKNRMRGIR